MKAERSAVVESEHLQPHFHKNPKYDEPEMMKWNEPEIFA